MDKARPAVGLALALGAAAAMGSAAPALKALASTALSAVDVVQARTMVGALVLMTVAIVVRRGRVRVARRDWWLIGAYGVISLAVNQVVFTMSLTRLPVGVALLLEYLAPVLVALWVRCVQRQKVSGLAWLGIAGTLVGLALVGQVWTVSSIGSALDGTGFGLGLLAAATMAARFVLAEQGLRRHDPLVLAAWGATVSAAVLALIGSIAPLPMTELAGAVALNGTPVPVTLLVLWVGIVGTGAGALLAIAAQRWLAPTSASLVLTLEVLVGATVAYVLLGEAMIGIQMVGGAVMLAGVALAQLGIALGSPDPGLPPP